MKKKWNTTLLLRKIIQSNDISALISENEEEFLQVTFHEELQNICKEKGLIAEHVIRDAQIERSYGHQLFNGTRNPSRDKVIQIGIGLRMSLEELQKLLRIAGKNALYPKIRRDAAIVYAVSKNMNMRQMQELLESLELPILGNDS